MSEPELKACPFCGGDDIHQCGPTNGLWAFECESCGARTAWRMGCNVSFDAWNRRAADPSVERLAEALRNPSEAMLDAGLATTAAFLDLPGSAVTVNREKMRRRYLAVLESALSAYEAGRGKS